MNIFNRIVVVILLLFLVFISAIGIINIYAGFFTWAEIPSLFLSPDVRMNPVIGTIILAAIFLVSILILVFEFYRRKPKRAAISDDNRGKSMVTTKSVSKEVEQKLMSFDEIKDTRVKTLVKREGVYVDIYAKISEEENVNLLTENIRNSTYDFLTQKLGLKVAQIDFTITGFIPEPQKAKPAETAPSAPTALEQLIEETKAAVGAGNTSPDETQVKPGQEESAAEEKREEEEKIEENKNKII